MYAGEFICEMIPFQSCPYVAVKVANLNSYASTVAGTLEIKMRGTKPRAYAIALFFRSLNSSSILKWFVFAQNITFTLF